MSGTAANAAGGARTQVSTITTSMLFFLTLAFLTPVFHNLPEAVLAAIVIHAVAHLADVAELRRFARLRTGSIWGALAALAGVLAFGILRGLLLAICLTLIALMKRLSMPQVSVLGRIPATGTFIDIERHPDTELVPGLLIVRPNTVLFFANANRVLNRVRELIKAQRDPVHVVILNLEAVPELDLTTLDLLEQLRSDLQTSGIRLALARVTDRTRDLLARSGFLSRLGEENIFWGVDAAVAVCSRAAAAAG